MPRPDDSSVPRLAPGCRMSATQEMLLVPEGALRLHGPGRRILECCDGQRTFRDIVDIMRQQYASGDAGRIEEETATFLERLHARRVVNF